MSWYRSLFFKIFLWFWLVVFLAMGLAVVSSEWIDNDYFTPASRQDVMLVLNLIERQPPILAEGRKLWRHLQPGWNLVAVQVDSVDELPHDLEEFADQAVEEGELLYGQNDGWLMIGPVQTGDYLYIAVSRREWQNLLDDRRRWIVPGAILLLVTSLCFLLVWSLTRPIRRLQQTVRQMADGNFDVSLLQRDLSRRDEIGQLVVEVTSMAEATHRLLQSQQQLLRDVSHELRSPLTRLQIALGIARKKDQQGVVSKELARIERAVAQVENLISQILDLARLSQLDTAALMREQEAVDLMLNNWLEDAELEIANKQLQLQFVNELGGREVSWDWILIERAVDNLLRNAIRYSPEGGQLSVNLATLSNGLIAITIADQGPGVPDDMLDAIFAPFTQVDQIRSPGAVNSGYGLGLALVRRIVELHGGSVIARNRNPGLEVVLLLPAGE
jgi:two-component system, OmpR family, sensor histidine kinase CpxA